MIEITKYNKPKKTGVGDNRVIINSNNSSNQSNISLEPHTIFGQIYDGTQDVGGDLSNVTNITAIGGDIVVKSTTDEQDKIGGNIIADGNITAKNTISASKLKSDQAELLEAIIKNLSGDQINYLVGVIKEISGSKLTYDDATIKDLLAGNISVDTLTVTKAAHFFSLIIDEIKSVGGQIILTPANAKVDKVKALENAYKCYWKATDGDKNIYNQFAKDDQVVCQTFNLGQSNTNVSNTFYWRLCTEVGTETIDDVLYNYIILSDTDKDTATTSSPTVGDKIAQLGNKTDSSRQNAIILSAYNSKFLDAELVAPSIVQYAGINDYQLKTHRKNVISSKFNEFIGNFKVSNGMTIEEYIKNSTPEIQNGKDGHSLFAKAFIEGTYHNGFTKGVKSYVKVYYDGNEVTDFNVSYRYKGAGQKDWCQTQHIKEDSWNDVQRDGSTLYVEYVVEYKGLKVIATESLYNIKDGEDAEFYKLKPLIEIASVDKDGKFGISLNYNIQHIVGNLITNINAGEYYVRFRQDNNQSYIKLSVGNDSPSYINLKYQTKYYDQTSKVVYLVVELVKGNVIYDSRIVPVILMPSATFEIKQKTDTELASITSRVTDNETKTENGIKTLTNQFSTIEQKANGIESRVGKIESSKQNIINDKQFFINGDNQPHQFREYDVTTDTFTFKSTDITNDIDFGSEFIKLDAGKYVLSFTPTLNGQDIRMQVRISLYAKAAWDADNTIYKVIDYSDIPQHRLYIYEFTITEEKPYLWLYLESAAQQNQKTLPWIIKLQNTKLLRFSESESLIKQTSENIVLDAKTVQVNNNGKLSALFENGKIKADYIESNNGVFTINDKGFYYQGQSDLNNGVITTEIYNDGFHTKTDETIGNDGLYSSVDISSKANKYNVDITSTSQGGISIQAIPAQMRNAITIRDGNVSGLRQSTTIATFGTKYLNTYQTNIIVTGGNKNTVKGSEQVTLVLPDNYTLNNGKLASNSIADRYNYIKQYNRFPETVQEGQEYTILKRCNAKLIITVDYDTQECYPIVAVNTTNTDVYQIENGYDVTIPANWYGVIKILFDGYYWNLIQL